MTKCQPPSSSADRSSGERSSLWRTSSARSGSTTRNRTRRSSAGIRAWRRRTISPSIAVHSTSHRKAARPRTYQMTSTSSRSSARIRPRYGGPASSRSSRRSASGTPSIRRACWRPPIQHAKPSRWPRSTSRRDQLAVLPAARREVVGRDQAVRRAGEAPVAVEAGADERLVGQVRAGEQAGDPVQERGLGERAGRGQEAVDGPLDAIREGDGGGLAVGAVAEPPAILGHPDQAAAVGAGEGVADQREESVDVVGRASPPRRARRCRGRRVGPSPAVSPGASGGRRRAHEAAEVAGPVQADEDLAQQPVEADGLAAELEHARRPPRRRRGRRPSARTAR